MRRGLKGLAFAAAVVAVLPAWISFQIRGLLLGRDRALLGSTQALSLVPGLTGQYLRRGFLWLVLERCAISATVEFGTIFSRVDARLDENVYVGPGCHIGSVHLERDVLLAASVHVPSGPDTHGTGDPTRPIRDQPGTLRTVRIGRGTWVASAAVVLEDVGPNSIIAAGAVVTEAIPGGVVAGGVPARILRHRGAA
jgi:acetyltransferase-like isoleucine patch superfamily enzyme